MFKNDVYETTTFKGQRQNERKSENGSQNSIPATRFWTRIAGKAVRMEFEIQSRRIFAKCRIACKSAIGHRAKTFGMTI
jgi:hypothetical protein